MQWNKTNEYYEGTTTNFKFTKKIASFDLDDTLVTPKNKKDKKDKKNTFSNGPDDWRWLYDNIVIDKLKELHGDGYCIVIVSNQMGIGKGKVSGDDWIKKIENINDELKLEMKVFCSINNNKYRKPIPTFFKEFFPDKISSKSFYCGDACGRKDDFSDTDYKFAFNCDLNFYTPEQLFLKEKYTTGEITYCLNFNDKKKFNFKFEPSTKKEMLIMVGMQGSGKSHISKYISDNYNYEIVNRDTEKTMPKCVKKAMLLSEANKNLIIDNTNPSKEARKTWIDIAKQHNYNVRILHMNTDIELCKHNNIYRSITKNIDIVPDIAYNMYKSKYEKPDAIDECVNDIINIEPSYPEDSNYFNYFM
jgi:bifunctional polynucleotide phosphatase/kinase